MNTTAIFKVTAAIIIGLTAAIAFRRWFSQNFWQAAGLCAVSSASAIFLFDTFGNYIPGNVHERIYDKTFSVMRSVALGGFVLLVAANYKLATLIADLFLFKLPNKQ